MKPDGYTASGCAWFKQLFLGAALVAAPITAGAEDFASLPHLATVTGLAANDTLNVRETPSAKSADIGDINQDQTVEVLELDPSGKWARILQSEGNGWVSTRYLAQKARAVAPSGLPLGLQCSGTEPFWSAKLGTDSTVRFDVMGQDAQSYPLDWSSPSRNRGGAEFGLSSKGMTGILRRAACSDGMSDRAYGWALDLIVETDGGKTLLGGCCSAQLP